ncbi:MAG: hypothetical protein LBR13_03625, partial [Dysgonamonadaceae bacterium]|nr:hypothetical protein [Dysgonamonadaceae bacterium]
MKILYLCSQKNKNIMPNSKQWSSATPGHIVLMLDQSGSTSNDYGTTGLTKAAFAAQTLNNL